jgi:hypothetical protein
MGLVENRKKDSEFPGAYRDRKIEAGWKLRIGDWKTVV